MNIQPSKPSLSQPLAPLAAARSRQAAPTRPEPSAPARVAAQEGQDPRGRLESFNEQIQARLANFIEAQGLNPEQAAIVKEAAAEFSSLIERLASAFDRGAQSTEHLAAGLQSMMENLRADVQGALSVGAQVDKTMANQRADTQRMEPGKPMPERMNDTMPMDRMNRTEPGKPMPLRTGMAMNEVSAQDRIASFQSMMSDRISNGLMQSGLSDSQMNMLKSAQQSFDALLERMSSAVTQNGGMQPEMMSKGFTFIMNSLRNDVQAMLQAVPSGLNKMA